VVVVGFTVVEPLAEAELNPPGEIEIDVAPLVAQFSEQLAPGLMLVGLAAKEVIEGAEPVPEGASELTVWAQLGRPIETSRRRKARVPSLPREELPFCERTSLLHKELGESPCDPVVVMAHKEVYRSRDCVGYWSEGQNWARRTNRNRKRTESDQL
jgi:hypothetical protein